MAFKFCRKTVFLTFPQFSFDKQEYLEYMNSKFGVHQYIIAKELHQDGNPHMHCYFLFMKQVHSNNSKVFDYQGHHPNIQTPNKKDAIARVKAYCMKGKDFIKSDDIQIQSARECLFQTILEIGLTKELVIDNPTVMSLNFSSIQQWCNLAGRKNLPLARKVMPKKRHLWLYGESNSGKSWWLNSYLSLFEASEIPTNNDWNGIDQNTEVLYLDEFKGQIIINSLNRICDGYTKLNTKGGSTFIGYPRVVICSNYSIEECYGKVGPDILSTLYNRFNEFNIRSDGNRRGLGTPLYKQYATCEL